MSKVSLKAGVIKKVGTDKSILRDTDERNVYRDKLVPEFCNSMSKSDLIRLLTYHLTFGLLNSHD